MKPTDLDQLALPGDPQLHPDGVRVAFVLSELDLDDDRQLRTIHLFDGQRTRRFTHGPSDTTPRWSPDGRWLAFLRTGTEPGQKPQLHVMPADGGEAQRRTDLPLGVSALDWSPDSAWLVVVAGVLHPELADLDEDERRRRPKRITRLPYRTDSQGWIHDRQDRLHLVAVDGDRDAAPVVLDTGDGDVSLPQWRPDGAAIGYLGDAPGLPDTEPHNQVHEVPLDPAALQAGGTDVAGPPVAVTAPGMWSSVRYHPDGRVFVTGLRDPFDWPGTSAVWFVPTGDAAGGVVPVTAHLDRDVTPGAPAMVSVGPRFVADGFLTALEGRGTTGIVHVDLAGWDPAGVAPPEVTEVVAGPRCVTGFTVRPDGGALAFTVTDPATPGELIWREGGHERNVTDLARRFRAAVDVRPTERFSCEHGGVELDVWAVLPPGFDEAAVASVPVLLNIHGGPTAQYGAYFLDEFQVEAAAGYLVVGTNPRGSSGRGTDWARAVVGAWGDPGSVDTLDLEQVVDAALARYPQADPDRVGIMGGSYGGYATARILTRTDRYRSAIVERGLLQWESFSGTSDIGPFFDRMFLGASLAGSDGALHRAASPVSAAASITTPTLVLHSEADWRCPPEQGEQLFVALKHAGVTTELVRFPDESHELSRSGQPRHRRERFEIVLEWHDRHLRAGPPRPGSSTG